VIDPVAADLVDHLRQYQTVGRQTQLEVGRMLPQKTEGLEGLLRIRERMRPTSSCVCRPTVWYCRRWSTRSAATGSIT
jgi:hypothetical protein